MLVVETCEITTLPWPQGLINRAYSAEDDTITWLHAFNAFHPGRDVSKLECLMLIRNHFIEDVIGTVGTTKRTIYDVFTNAEWVEIIVLILSLM